MIKEAFMAYCLKTAARLVSLSWRAVLASVSNSDLGLLLFTPTEQTNALPEPLSTIELEKRKGSLPWCWPSTTTDLKAFSFSVKNFSSTVTSLPSRRRQSAGIMQPGSRTITSPTTSLLMLIVCVTPFFPRTTPMVPFYCHFSNWMN